MGKNSEQTLHEKAIRLIEGGVVEISGHFVRAIRVYCEEGCHLCEMDSACDSDMIDLCSECEMITNKRYILRFAYKKDK